MGMSVEDLAKVVHETNALSSGYGIKLPPWNEISIEAKELCRLQAKQLLSKLDISPRKQMETLEDVQAAAKRGFNS